MDTQNSPATLRTAHYCRSSVIFIDADGLVAGFSAGFAPPPGLALQPGSGLPMELADLSPGGWRFLEGGWFAQAEGRSETEVLILRKVRTADRVLGPYPDSPVNEEMVRLLLDNPYEGLSAVDREGLVTYLSPTNEEWFKLPAGGGAGLALADLSPGSRLPQVAQSGVADHAQLMDLSGKTKITVNLPLKSGGELVGGFGRILFQSPKDVEKLADRVRSMERQVERYETLLSELRPRRWTSFDILTVEPAMRSLVEQVRRVADSGANVLLLGESGTGKELFAQALHHSSRRAKGPFIAVNCGAIPRDLIEAELFGYEEGAFSGARRKGKPGKFELATGGTIFLDEVGELPLESQAKLLRVIEERTVERLGGTGPVKLDFRLVAATHRDLAGLADQGKFRADLYYRIHEIPFEIPPLRARPADIPLLAAHFLTEVCRAEKLPPRTLSPEALEAFSRYRWPGNVRELRSLMRRLAWQVREATIEARHLPPAFGKGEATAKTEGAPLKEEVAKTARAAIVAALEASGGNKAKAAKALGIHRTDLYRKLKKLGL